MRYFHSLAVRCALSAALAVPAVAQTVWAPRNPVTASVNLTGVVWTGTQLVAVGDGGTIVTSPDGYAWTLRNSGTTNGFYGVAKDDGTGASSRLVAVGVSGTIRLSTNGGNTWIAASTPGAVMYAVTWAGNRFVAVGAGGAILTSPDGSSWTQQTSPTDESLNGIVWNGNLLMAVGDSGTAITSPDGTNWERRHSGITGSLYSVTWAGGAFVAVGQSGAVRTTTDGTTWTPRTSNAGTLFAVAQGSKLVAVGNAGQVTSSPDGMTWTVRETPGTSRLQAVTWMGTQFVAVGQGGVVLVSPDGDNWSQTSSSRANFNAVTSSGSLRVAVGDGGAIVTSPDGVTWTARASGTTNHLYGVAWNGTRFVVVGQNGTIRSSEDGVTWTTRSPPQPSTLSAVTWTGTDFVAVSTNSYVISSSDGITWTERSTQTGNSLYAVTSTTFGSAGLIGAGVNGNGGPMIRTSTGTGGAWTNRPVSGSGSGVLYGVVANGTTAVAVGAGGAIFTSPTGTAWIAATSGVTTALFGATWTGDVFVAVGAGGTVLSSPDGTAWTPHGSGVNNALNAVHWDGAQLIAVGAGGTILTSSPDATPPTPAPLTPSAGETNVPVNARFSWSASGGATSYTLQVASSSGFSDPLLDTTLTGTSLLHGPLATGTQYFWRVRANGSSGSSGWSDPSSFATTSGASAAPVLALPADAAVDVPLSTTLSWNAYPGATSYQVQVSASPDFGALLVNDSLTGTSRILGALSSSTTYHWRVYARLPSGVTDWSAPRQFTTTSPPPPTPVLVSPANGATAVPLSTTLTWNASAGASAYRVQVATASDFSVIFRDSIVTGATSMALTGLSVNGVYYWRVRAQNAAGNSAFSAGRNFTTATSAPAVPTPSIPAAGALDVSVYTSLAWLPAEGALTYRLQLSTSPDFSTTLVDDATLTGTSFTPAAPLAQATTYYWRLSATNPVGTSAFSATRSFTTGLAPTGPPSPPILLTPVQFAAGLGLTPTLSWNPSATATSYHVQVSTTPEFATMVTDDSLAGTSLAIGPLSGGTAYYWRVRAINQLGAGAWSDVQLFSTLVVAPAVPTLVSPPQFATNVGISPTLTWNPVAGATSYRVQVAFTPDFATLFVNDSLTATSRTLTSLAENTDHYWRVRAVNSAGLSGWSSVYRFTTGVAPVPGIPELLTPVQFADSVPRQGVLLTWTPVDGAMYYRVQLSKTTSFASTVLDDSLVPAPSRFTGQLEAKTTYYWRVLARNNSGTSGFSLPFRFTTDGTSAILMNRVLIGGAGTEGGRVLRFAMPRAGRVTVLAYDTRGELVARIFDGLMPAGEHALALPAGLRAGVHLLDFRAGDYRTVVKTAP